MFPTLSVKLRKQTGKKATKQIRKEGLLPAVLYGQKDNLSIAVNPKELVKILKQKGRNTLINIDLKSDSIANRNVLLKEFQNHPLKKEWLHADFLEVDMSRPLKIRVPVRLTGASLGVKKGGILNHVIQELKVECLPENIPETITVSVDELDLEDAIRVSDLQVPEQITVLDSSTATVAVVHAEKIVEEKPAEGEEAAAPAGGEEAKTLAKIEKNRFL